MSDKQTKETKKPWPDGPITGEWLDQPATINGEYVYLSKTFPWQAKVMFSVVGAAGLACVALIVLAVLGVNLK